MLSALRKRNSIACLFFWDILNTHRQSFITSDGRNVLLQRMLFLAGWIILILGILFWGGLEFREWLTGMNLLDMFAPVYSANLFFLLGLSGIFTSVLAVIFAVLKEDDTELSIRSYPILEKDYNLYRGYSALAGAIILTFLIGLLFLLFGQIVWKPGAGDFFSGLLIVFLVSCAFCIISYLIASLVLLPFPTQKLRGIITGSVFFAALAGLVIFVYFNNVWSADYSFEVFWVNVTDILLKSHFPTAWGAELYTSVQSEGWFVSRSLLRILGLAGISLFGVIVLHRVLPVTNRLAENTLRVNQHTVTFRKWRINWLSPFILSLPFGTITKAFLKKDLRLFFRDSGSLVKSVITVIPLFIMGMVTEHKIILLVLIYFLPFELVHNYLHNSLKTEGSNLDYIKMLVVKGEFIFAKILSAFWVIWLISAILLALIHFIPNVLEHEISVFLIRLLIISFAGVLATFINMILNEQTLTTGKQSMDRSIITYLCGIALSVAWMGIDLIITDRQILPDWGTIVFTYFPIPVLVMIVAYCIYRFIRFSQTIDEI